MFTKRSLVTRKTRRSEEQKFFVQADILGDHPVLKEHYDFATCMDGIEHLTEQDGWTLLERMKQMADKIVLFTPLDPWCMNPADPSPESHKSLWNPEVLASGRFGIDYASVVFPQYHKLLTTSEGLPVGAFFFWWCRDLDEDFERVKSLLNFK